MTIAFTAQFYRGDILEIEKNFQLDQLTPEATRLVKDVPSTNLIRGLNHATKLIYDQNVDLTWGERIEINKNNTGYENVSLYALSPPNFSGYLGLPMNANLTVEQKELVCHIKVSYSTNP